MPACRAFVGLGSNLGDRLLNLSRAVLTMQQKGLTVVAASSVYETDPVGPRQPDFLNAALELDCALPAAELIAVLKAAEVENGREPGPRWGPRLIDLDLLLYGDLALDEPGLTLPHPELTRRAFALVPVLEIDEDLQLPSGEPLSAFCEKNPAGIKLFCAPARLLAGR